MLLSGCRPSPRRIRSGFSLIELMVAITLVSLIAVLGAPSLLTFLENNKIRNAAQSFYTGAQLARSEAVRRNTTVQLVLLLPSTAPSAANVNATNIPDNQQGDRNWMVRAATPVAGEFEFIEGKALQEGNANSAGAVIAYTQGTITFGPMSNVTNLSGASVTYNFSNPAGGACANAGPMQCLRVVISPGGRIQLCDPSVLDVADTRKCSV